ncbi:MAG: cysteine desulfurase [Clostridia bacterium]|nr:cysteine desulfurase [Clostridia bacterium]
MTQKEIYLDNSATTPLSAAARAKIAEAIDIYGNPSSLHSAGQAAERLLETARRQVLEGLGVRQRRDGGALVFTSSGTEATSLALFGSAYAKERRTASRILTTNSEHPSVARVMDKLASDGFEVVRISTRGGALDMDELKAALDKSIFLASFMLVNNETGAIYSVGEAFKAIKQKYPDAITHCDAVQGFMKVPFTPASLSADLVTVSAHKLHAPKGVGALYISAPMLKAKKIAPFILGGGQENGMRSGTENVIGISAFGASVEDISKRRSDISAHTEELRAYADERLSALDVRLNLPSGKRLANIINITLPDIKSETMLHALSSDGIYVSSGSACSSHSKHPSDSLSAFGLSAHEADCSLRISMSEYNTKEDIDALCNSLVKNIARLVKIK